MRALFFAAVLFVCGYVFFQQRTQISSLEREREEHQTEIQNLKTQVAQLETRLRNNVPQRSTALTPPATSQPAKPAATPRGDWMSDPNAASRLNKKP